MKKRCQEPFSNYADATGDGKRDIVASVYQAPWLGDAAALNQIVIRPHAAIIDSALPEPLPPSATPIPPMQ